MGWILANVYAERLIGGQVGMMSTFQIFILSLEYIQSCSELTFHTETQFDNHEFEYPIREIFDFQISKTCHHETLLMIKNRPRGKESTEVRITQNKGKESENSYQKLKRSQ